ncbi:hypothetical protein [Pseudomonas aeruginosa]|uniref:hypothetical protein n=1 Tax=Pseudomonas aeruginosa TaxID=287 RepID=UPI000F534CE9|nr:hypothetical protein [Pseudomonas aeruginosa]MDI3569514.1 hypothetical protein [Pseudomonas aeruginosa]MDI3586143.1 hypothetical protein [Pseudomonas aeruginosa]MDI3739811.1 hypothetical protein [Pseudomonas aeruginosa]MDI3768832.1 hypothetical protein [Pseudomonas aeruginosa]MDI3800974.1 hypothetical protein [Pseudomonas aeruginosa]
MTPEGLQASITTGVGTFVTASCMKFLPPEHTQYGIVVCSLAIPFAVLFLTKIFIAYNEPQALVEYKALLKKDLRGQKKILKDKNISEKTRSDIKRKYSETLVKLSTAHQDYPDDGVAASKVES